MRAGLVDWRFVLLGSLLGFAALECLYFTFRPNGLWGGGMFYDGHTYLNAARDWMAGRDFYEAWQFAPYRHPRSRRDPVSAQSAGVLVPFTFLPDPFGRRTVGDHSMDRLVVATVLLGLGRHCAFLCYPFTFGNYLFGDVAMWVTALVALATAGWPAFGPLVFIKPAPTPAVRP